MNLGLTTPVELKTNLSRAEAIDRLKRSVDQPRWFSFVLGGFGIVGVIGTDVCWFEDGGGMRRNNRRLVLNFRDLEGGTLLEGAFLFPRFRILPLLLFFIIALFMGAVSLFAFLSAPANWALHSLFTSLLPCGIPLFGFLILKFNLWMGRGSEQMLLESLEQILRSPATWGKDGKEGPVPSGLMIRPKVRQPRVWRSDGKSPQ